MTDLGKLNLKKLKKICIRMQHTKAKIIKSRLFHISDHDLVNTTFIAKWIPGLY